MKMQVYSSAATKGNKANTQRNKPRIGYRGTVDHCSEVTDRLLKSSYEGGDLEFRT